jgi:hypothetical protein
MQDFEMENEFVIYPLALRMKALGFNEPCLGSYYSDSEENFKEGAFDYRRQFNIEYSVYSKNTYYILAPTWQSAFKWLIPQINDKYKVSFREKGWFIYNLEDGEFQGVEALEKLIEIVEQKQR